MWTLALLLLIGQSESKTYVYDGTGNRREWSNVSAGDSRTSETYRNLNGRSVPHEQTEEKVISNEGGVRVVERVVRKFDPNGNALPPEKTVIETATRSDGSATEKVTTYRGDVNGRLQPVERAVSEVTKAGDSTRRETSIERNTLNGSFEAVERRVANEVATKTSSNREEITYTRDNNGRFNPTYRTVVKAEMQGALVQEQTDEYDATSTGKMELARQSVARTNKDATGAERRQVDVFVPGATGGSQLKERQIFTTRPNPDGTVVEVFSVQRPSVNSPRDLGPERKVSETVCKGKCAGGKP